MIPEFPEFKKLKLSHRSDVEKITSQFHHYSDFNFVSMWSWNIHNKVKLSKLNGNLVVIFTDYVSGEQFLSFMGNQEIVDTTAKLISFSKKYLKNNYLKLIPEELLLKYKGSEFVAEIQRDTSDYIYLVEDLVGMHEWVQNDHARRIRKFINLYPNYTTKHSSVNQISKRDLKKMFKKWSENKNLKDNNEYLAFRRFLKLKDDNIIYISIYLNKNMIGFSAYEVLSDGYAIAHFSKGDTKIYPEVFDVLNWEEAKFFHKQGVKYLNWEQDLGIPGLRYSKERYRPYFLMRKLIVSGR